MQVTNCNLSLDAGQVSTLLLCHRVLISAKKIRDDKRQYEI